MGGIGAFEKGFSPTKTIVKSIELVYAVSRSQIGGVVRRQQIVDLALLVAADDGLESLRQMGVRLDGVEFAGLDL